MNAAEQAKSLEAASKIASVVNLFKSEFPDARADLKPWANDPDTRELVDPDSIDIGFHLPGFSRLFQSRSILLQIRFHEDALSGDRRAIGAEVAGFNHRGKQWWLSTVHEWTFEGETTPAEEVADRLKVFLQQALALFNQE
ncbi:MAG: hypothetical protein IGS48_13870 [Oscillatoriales cyanobacterium C42_A2020_001]|nr:hypothetical protein [Leptolyngbyaceae cyanobacterium C42_A2020_001]